MSDFINPERLRKLTGTKTAGAGGIAAYDCVYASGEETILPADASAKSTAMVVALAEFAIAEGTGGEVSYGGEIENLSWSWSGANKKIYLNEATHKISESYPTTLAKWIICLGVTLGTTRILFEPQRMLVTEVI